MKLDFLKSVLLLLGACFAFSAAAYDVEDNGVYYTLNSKTGTATVTWLVHYNAANSEAYKGRVVVPESITVDGVEYPVTAVAARTFYFCTDLVSVTLPSTVTTIGLSAFQGCTGLEEVVLPPHVANLENATFQNCVSLENIDLPGSIISIGQSAFAGCTSLKSVNLPDNCGFIDTGAFAGCTALESVKLPKYLGSVGYRVFSGCTAIESVAIPDYIADVNISMFENCSSLKSVYLGAGVNQIEPYAFAGCPELNDLYIAPTTPPSCGNASAFKGSPMKNVHVEPSAVETYHSNFRTIWKDFENILPMRCSTPTVTCNKGNLYFATDTNLNYASVSEHYTYSISVSDVSDGDLDDADAADFGDFSLTYDVSVKAEAEGVESSNEVHATLCWIDHNISVVKAEDYDVSTGIDAPRPQRPVVVQSNGGEVRVSGLDDGERVSFYDLSGHLLGSAAASGDCATIRLLPGQTIVARVGNSSFKLRVN